MSDTIPRNDPTELGLDALRRRVTELEGELEEKSQLFEAAQALAHIGSWQWFAETDSAIWSHEMFRIAGRDPHGPTPSFAEFLEQIHTDDRDRVIQEIAAALESGSYEGEYRIRQLDTDDERTLVSRARVDYHPDGKPARMIGVIEDITERHRTEVELAERERTYRLLAENITDVIWTRDAELKLTYCSPSVTALLGYTPEELANVHRQDRITPESVDRFTAEIEDIKLAIADGRLDDVARRLEVEQFTKDQRRVWVEIDIRAVANDSGELIHVLGVSRDITDRKRAEEARQSLEREMQQSQRLESLGVLAGGIAHDFNNILMAILGNAEMLQRRLAHDSSVGRHVDDIGTAAHRAADLCRQMLAYAGRGRLEIGAFDVGCMVEESVHLIRASVSKKTDFELDLAHDLPPVEGDRSQLQQVVMNLIINASEALEEGPGAVAVSARCVWCPTERLHRARLGSGLPAGHYLEISVADTGCGMDQSTIDRVFEPFFSTKFAGRGLGMSAVLGIVRGHRGALEVESDLCRGTTFRVLLPIAAAATADVEPERDSPSAPWRGHGRILLADDEEAIRSVGTGLLEELGFEVTTVENGRQAVAAARCERFDLIVLDLTMPEMSGDEAFVELHTALPGVPVVISSGFCDADVMALFAGDRPAAFLQKPYSLDSLRECLRRVVTA